MRNCSCVIPADTSRSQRPRAPDALQRPVYQDATHLRKRFLPVNLAESRTRVFSDEGLQSDWASKLEPMRNHAGGLLQGYKLGLDAIRSDRRQAS